MKIKLREETREGDRGLLGFGDLDSGIRDGDERVDEGDVFFVYVDLHLHLYIFIII